MKKDYLEIINTIIVSKYLRDTDYEIYTSNGTIRRKSRNAEGIKRKIKK